MQLSSSESARHARRNAAGLSDRCIVRRPRTVTCAHVWFHLFAAGGLARDTTPSSASACCEEWAVRLHSATLFTICSAVTGDDDASSPPADQDGAEAGRCVMSQRVVEDRERKHEREGSALHPTRGMGATR